MFRKKISWIKIFDSEDAAISSIPFGQLRTFDVGKKRICIAHTGTGFFAVNDRCPHNGASLGRGHCTPEGSIVCPVHRYHFDLKTGRAKSGLGDFVQTYPIEFRKEGVFIGFEELSWNLF